MWKCYLVVILSVLQCVTCRTVKRCSTNGLEEPTQELQVSIIVSPVAIDNISRHLILSWDNVSPSNGGWVGLFDKEPSANSVSLALFKVQPQISSGWETTGFYEKAVASNELGFTKKCLNFWAAYISADNSTVIASSCLQTEPTWMADMQTALSPLMLRQIFLVGSHDSGSYEEYNPSTSENLVTKYTITQEDDILSQLIYGVRYLDIRAAYYPSTNETWWVNHGVMKIHPMKLILDDVKTFLENTNEIVILDFHEFPAGFGSGLDIHTKLVEYLKEEIGEFAASPSLTWNARTGDIWSSGKRLIVSYNNNDAVAQSDMLWPAVSQQWGNVQTLEDLYSYLSQVMASPPGSKAWSAMVELTPTTMQVITDELGGLRRMAAMVNQNVTAWYRGTWGKTVNIVSADFFRDTGLVEAAISWNHFRSQQLACK